MQSNLPMAHNTPDADALRKRFLSEYKNDLETVARNYLERPVTHVVTRRGGLPSWKRTEEFLDDLQKWTNFLLRAESAPTDQQWRPLLDPETKRLISDVREVFKPWWDANKQTKTYYGLQLFRQAVFDLLDWFKKEKSIVPTLGCLVSLSHPHTGGHLT